MVEGGGIDSFYENRVLNSSKKPKDFSLSLMMCWNLTSDQPTEDVSPSKRQSSESH